MVPTLEVIYPDLEIHDYSAQIHAALRMTGKVIGIGDIFIAATALSENCTLVNANTKHFQRVIDIGFLLRIENWREL